MSAGRWSTRSSSRQPQANLLGYAGAVLQQNKRPATETAIAVDGIHPAFGGTFFSASRSSKRKVLIKEAAENFLKTTQAACF